MPGGHVGTSAFSKELPGPKLTFGDPPSSGATCQEEPTPSQFTGETFPELGSRAGHIPLRSISPMPASLLCHGDIWQVQKWDWGPFTWARKA